MKYLLLILLLGIPLVATTKIALFYKTQNNKNFESWMSERDCRFELEIYLRRERGEISVPPNGLSDCGIDPLLEKCACGRI